MVKAVFFDLDETLLDHSFAERKAALSFHGHFRAEIALAADDFAVRWRELAEKWFDLYGKGLATFQGQRRGRLREIFGEGLGDGEADRRFDFYIGHYEQHWKTFADVVPCLDALKGFRLGVITNGAPDQQNKKLERTGIRGRFEQVVCSVEAGHAKPDAEIFRIAAGQMGVGVGDCVYVGDRLETDALAASGAGMRGIWLNRPGNPGAGSDVIRSLGELPGRL